MSEELWTVDAHCHWSDARVFKGAPKRIRELTHFRAYLLGGVEPEEWSRQTELKKLFPEKIYRAFALHPYFVAANPKEELEAAMTRLSAEIPGLDAVGEIGLDFRKAFRDSRERQLEYFARQLDLAQGKPVILHIVRAHEEALKILKKGRGMLHAFTGSIEIAQRYLQFGYHISVGAKLLHPETHTLHRAVKEIPIERLLLESDGPDQPPPGKKEHDSETIWGIAKVIAQSKNLSLEQVVEHTRANFYSLFQKGS